MSETITVFVVESDQHILRAMARLMKAIGFHAVCLKSVDALLELDLPSGSAVILLDVKTTQQSGDTQERPLEAKSLALPVIYLTDRDTERTRSEARRMGAAGYFRKPVDEQALADAIFFAVSQSDSSNHFQ